MRDRLTDLPPSLPPCQAVPEGRKALPAPGRAPPVPMDSSVGDVDQPCFRFQEAHQPFTLTALPGKS
jgi:hypothetical protein